MRLTTPFVWEEYYRESYSADTPLGNFYMEPTSNFLDMKDEEKEWFVYFGNFDTEIGIARNQEQASRIAENWLVAVFWQMITIEMRDI